MTPNDRPTTLTPGQVTQALSDLAMTSRPDYRDDLVRRTANTRQRPVWTFLERWLPMSLVTARHSTAPPMRAAWTLLLVAAITTALVAGLAIAGSVFLREARTDRLNGLIPVLVTDEAWATSSNAGLSVPTDLDLGPDGNLYVVNSGADEIVVIDPAGRVVRRWGSSGSGEGQFLFTKDPQDPLSPYGGIAVDEGGLVYVADLVNDRVQVFEPDGTFVRSWGGHGAEDGRFLDPHDVAIGTDGTILVVDGLRDDVQRFTPKGEWLETIGRHGTADGELDATGGIDVAADGSLLNADFGSGRIQAWDGDGAFLWSRGGGSETGLFRDPVDIDADPSGHLVVTDADGVKVLDDGTADPRLTTPPGWEVGWLTVGDDGAIYASSAATDSIVRLTVDMREAASTESGEPTSDLPAPSIDAAASPGSSSTAGGPATVEIGPSDFAIPFSTRLPRTIAPGTAYPGWRQMRFQPSVVSFQFVREADRTPAYVEVYLPSGVYLDPCHPESGLATTSDDPGVDEIVDALTHLTGFRASPVSDISLGDVRGKVVELDNNIDIKGCRDEPWLRLWTYRTEPGGAIAGSSEGLTNSFQRIAVVDVDGTPVLISAWEIGAVRDEVLDLTSIMESIRFQ
jgi:DNA-binding beta-propeller fold protein YncE